MLIAPEVLAKMDKRTAGQIVGVCIHHTVTKNSVTAEEVSAMEPFLAIGYNCLIRKAPYGWEIQEGRPALYVPAAQYGLNTEYYAISIAGNYQPGACSWTDVVDQKALDLVVTRVHQLREHYGATMPLKYLIGHRDVATIKKKEGLDPADFSTACPGDLLYQKLHDLRLATGLTAPPALL